MRTFILLISIFSSLGFSAGKVKLPVIRQVGIIPAQFHGDPSSFSDIQFFRQRLDSEFSGIVQKARRYRIINDELVESLWKDHAGRQELRREFELHGFINLNVSARSNVITLNLRMLGPNLETYMWESETVPRHTVMGMSEDSVDNLVKGLVFRLFNRIPIDVNVTSVQGGFVTLSGGKSQGIEVGDQVELKRVYIQSIHPANGSWQSFSEFPLGIAQIIEAKKNSSVAKLIRLTYEGAIELGDGARIPAVPSRVNFVRTDDKQNDFINSGNQAAVIVPPLYEEVPTKAQQESHRQADPLAAAPAVEKIDASPTGTVENKPQAGEGDAQVGAEDSSEKGEEESFWDMPDVSFDGFTDKIIDDISLSAGPYWWKAVGPRSASGSFPLYLFNRFYLNVNKSLPFNFKASYGGGVYFGSTPNGGHVGYDGHAKLFWQESFGSGSDLLQYWRAGGFGRFTGLSVSKERFGGGDFIRGGGFGGIGGTLVTTSKIDWTAEFGLVPINVGRIGYDGNFHSIESTRGTYFRLEGWLGAQSSQIKYGGAFNMADERMTVGGSTVRRYHLSEYQLEFLVGYDW